MNLFGQVFLAVLTLLFLFTLSSLVFSVVRNLREGLKFRRELGARVGSLRLHKMLARLGIDRTAYLHGVRVAETETHMAKCESCPTQAQCDQELAAEPADRPDYSFCPNEESLKRTAEVARAAG
jgi:hypothetical protein